MIYLAQHISYKKHNTLYVEDISIKNIGIDPPYYCYSYQAMIDNYQNITRHLPNVLICYAVKANPNLTVINTFAQQGAGADVVSEGEMKRAMQAGIKKIVFSGVGKTTQEIEFALQNDVYQLNAESIAELDVIDQVAKNLQKSAPVSIRVNLDVDGETLDKISTARKEDKFGIDIENLNEALNKNHQNIELVGLSIHIGSQISNIAVFDKAFTKLEKVIKEFRLADKITRLDLGGGFAIPYQNHEEIFDYTSYGKLLSRFSRDYQLIIEPGRSLVGNAGILVTKVLFVKQNNIHVIVDAGMNDMMRPAIYDSYHNIIPVHHDNNNHQTVDIVGPVCESSDSFAKQRKMPSIKQGELLAVCTVGAYGSSMSNNYNSRLLIPEIMVKGDKYFVIRKRQTYDEMISGEIILK